jgi:hypothetical protein
LKSKAFIDDGVKGKSSRALPPTPLLERKKSAIQGDINGSETRRAWIVQLCSISMESLEIGCTGSGFQCNFINPEQGQFPFLVKPRSTMENGFSFLSELRRGEFSMLIFGPIKWSNKK